MRARMHAFAIGFLFLVLVYVPDALGQQTIQTSDKICHMYGEAKQGERAWNKDDSCTIPRIEQLDTSYRQTNFICCGGGASSTTTSSDIPPGLELQVTGGHYWAVGNPKLDGNRFFLHTYCGPEPAPGPGCNVSVDVFVHYRVTIAPALSTPPSNSKQAADTKPIGETGTKAQAVDSKTSPPSQAGLGVDKFLAFAFGILFIVIMLLIAVKDRDPSPMGIVIYRVVLALAAAGIGAVIPGMIDVTVQPVIRAGGAIALFVIVFWFKPANLVAGPPAGRSINKESEDKETRSQPPYPPSLLPNGTPFPADQRDAFIQVWRSLHTLERAGQDLWLQVSDQNLSAFADRLREAQERIGESALFFADKDYDALNEMMRAANFYLGGKTNLSDIRNGMVLSGPGTRLAGPGEPDNFVDTEVRNQIRQNRRWLTRYRNLLRDIRSRFQRSVAV